MTTSTPLLDSITSPAELRQMKESDLPQFAAELRAETINAVAVTGGHLGSGLGDGDQVFALESNGDRLTLNRGRFSEFQFCNSELQSGRNTEPVKARRRRLGHIILSPIRH